VTGLELERRIRLTGMSFAQFAKLANVNVNTLYQYRREIHRPPVAVTAHLQTVLEALERARLAELLDMYPSQEETQNASRSG
jgi:transcriptional regulator with XRE-family HTH domain